jgi:hypothetical protein
MRSVCFLNLAECVQIVIYLALFVSGQTVLHALRAVQAQLVNVVA